MLDRNCAPAPTVRRLSLYLRQLEQLATEGVDKISSRKLGTMLHTSDTQIRKDLACFGQFGQTGIGYCVDSLIERLRHILGTDKIWKTIVIGAGDLGRTLLQYEGFLKKGFEPVAAFDISADKVGRRVGHVPVHHINELPQIVWKNNVKLAIVAVPTEAAQSVADMLCQVGIMGILTFAPITLETPPGVAVGVVDLPASLEQVAFRVGNGEV